MNDLLKKCYEILGVDLTDSLLLFREMEEQNLLNIIDEKVYLSHYYEAERNIENKIKALCTCSSEYKEKELKSIRLNPGYSEEQLEAIRNSITNKILILTGGPGTGKTTALKGIIDSYKQLKKNIMLAAPTGRAAKE